MNNKHDYSVLAVFLAAYLIYFLSNQTNPQALIIATIIFALSYICWGIWHHSRSHTLHPKIVLEYFLVAVLGVVIVATLLI